MDFLLDTYDPSTEVRTKNLLSLFFALQFVNKNVVLIIELVRSLVYTRTSERANVLLRMLFPLHPVDSTKNLLSNKLTLGVLHIYTVR